MNNKLYSIKLDGVGSNLGGKFENLDISGVYSISGDLMCNRLNVSGVIKSSKNIYANDMRVDGVLKGSESIEGKEVNVNGYINILKFMKAQNIYGEGCIKVKDSIESEKIDIKGNINCDGLINCEEFILFAEGESYLGEIGATNIDIQGDEEYKNIFKIFAPKKFKNNKAYIKIIEGDNIKLSDCEVDIVRGKNIIIGENCKINEIEYSGSIEINELSKVDNVNKV